MPADRHAGLKPGPTTKVGVIGSLIVALAFTGGVRAQINAPVADAAMQRNGAAVKALLKDSADVNGAWFGVSKAPLTICTSHGQNALIRDVPPAVIEVLRLVCPELVVVA